MLRLTSRRLRMGVQEFKKSTPGSVLSQYNVSQMQIDPPAAVDHLGVDASQYIGGSARIQEGDYTLYRAGDGRAMVLDFSSFEQRIEKPGPDEVATGDPSWTFKKASKRHVLWDELPF